jgi:hypothetical protein
MRTRADRYRLLLCALVSACGVAACGGSVGTARGSATDASSADGRTGGDDGAGLDASGGLYAPADAAFVACPDAPPADLTACPRAGMLCEYGSDPRSGCRMHVGCTASGQGMAYWKSDLLTPCAPIPAGPCPATEADAKALAICSPQGLFCNYGDDTCICTQCNGPCSPTARFTCYGPPRAPGCPKKKPDVGTSCAGSAQCTYGSCASDIRERDCMGGYWVDQPIACAL